MSLPGISYYGILHNYSLYYAEFRNAMYQEVAYLRNEPVTDLSALKFNQFCTSVFLTKFHVYL